MHGRAYDGCGSTRPHQPTTTSEVAIYLLATIAPMTTGGRPTDAWDRVLLLFAITLTCATQFVAPAVAHADSIAANSEQELADRYAPVVMVQAQPSPCSTDGEAFEPMSVDALLGNRSDLVAPSRHRRSRGDVGAAAGDLFGLGEGFYLDFPGSAIEPGCVYEQDFHRYTAEHPPTVYARLVVQDDRPAEIVLQYWFYWYYNDWNNKHESDWEGIQLVFPAATADAALSVEPTSIGYAQHESGERQTWRSAIVHRDGDHPVVFTSAGSHASYFDSALHLGRSAGEGFGCDDSTGPSDELHPEVVLLPDEAPAATDAFAWLAYEGRWGERHGGPYNGPTGPTTKDRWTRPDRLAGGPANIERRRARGRNQVRRNRRRVLRCGRLGFEPSDAPRPESRDDPDLRGAPVSCWEDSSLAARCGIEPPPARSSRGGGAARSCARRRRCSPSRSCTFTMIGVAAIPVAVVGTILGAIVQTLPIVQRLLRPDGINRPDGIDPRRAGDGRCQRVGVHVRRCSRRPDDERHRRRSSTVVEAIGQERARQEGPLADRLRAGGCCLSSFWAAPSCSHRSRCSCWFEGSSCRRLVMFDDVGKARAALARSVATVRRRWWHTAVTIGAVLAATKVVSTTIGLLVLIVAKPPFWLLSLMIVARRRCACADQCDRCDVPLRERSRSVGTVRVRFAGEPALVHADV